MMKKTVLVITDRGSTEVRDKLISLFPSLEKDLLFFVSPMQIVNVCENPLRSHCENKDIDQIYIDCNIKLATIVLLSQQFNRLGYIVTHPREIDKTGTPKISTFTSESPSAVDRILYTDSISSAKVIFTYEYFLLSVIKRYYEEVNIITDTKSSRRGEHQLVLRDITVSESHDIVIQI